MRNERGIALITTLLVVTLLTITVVEFTYTVQVDQRLVRNSLSAMQAALLARSGVNLAESFLARDTNDPPADWYYEDWASPEIATVVSLEADQRLKVQVVDEGGKININRTRPRPGAPPPQPNQPNLSPDAFLREALRRLFETFEMDVEIPDRLLEYWGQSVPAQGGRRQQALLVEEFRSLEDFGATFGIPADKLTKVSKFLTALPVGAAAGGQRDPGRVNVNTAPPEVLAAILNDAEQVDQILQRRNSEEPIGQGDLGEILSGSENRTPLTQIFGFTSSFFRIFSSAIVSADPTGRRLGGVGQTVVALVFRRPLGRVPQDAPPDTPRWTLTLLDWQKRGGAQVLVEAEKLEGESGGGRGAMPGRKGA
jgi:general secretion pathway protein K